IYLGLTPQVYPSNQLPAEVTIMQAPFTPSRKMYQTTALQANDPLVHYRIEDMRDRTDPEPVITMRPITRVIPLEGPYSNYLSNQNTRYNPWGGRSGASANAADYDYSLKDPGIFSPDQWDFPTAKFPH